MKFKEFLESLRLMQSPAKPGSGVITAYHQTTKDGVHGIAKSQKFNLGQGMYGPAVYLTLEPPKQPDHADYVVSARVDLDGFDMDADPSEHKGNFNHIPGFTFQNYDTMSTWVVVFDNKKLWPYLFSGKPYYGNQWFPLTPEGLEQEADYLRRLLPPTIRNDR